PDRRRSRGELPLRAAADGQAALKELYQAPATLARYDPFYLVCADLSSVLLLGWDGAGADLTDLGPATHVLTNAGHMYPPGRDNLQKPPDEKAAWFGPKFAASRPSGDPETAVPADAWGDGCPVPTGDGLAATDPRAIIVRRELPDGRIYGSTSVTLVALAADGRLRYDFQPDPQADKGWYPVETA